MNHPKDHYFKGHLITIHHNKKAPHPQLNLDHLQNLSNAYHLKTSKNPNAVKARTNKILIQHQYSHLPIRRDQIHRSQ